MRVDSIGFFQPLAYKASDLIKVLQLVESPRYRPSIEHLIHGSYELIDASVMVPFIKKQLYCCIACLLPFIDVAFINSLTESNVRKTYYQLRQVLLELIGLHLIRGFGENNNMVSVRACPPPHYLVRFRKETYEEASAYVRKRTTKEENAPGVNFVYELFKNVELKKKELCESLEKAAQALVGNSAGLYNEAMRELYSKKHSYGVRRIFKGLVSADKDDDKFQEIKVNAETANSPENFPIEMNRESNNQLYTEIPQLKTYDCWKAVAGTNKLKFRKLPCLCLSCRNEFYGLPTSESCQYKQIAG